MKLSIQGVALGLAGAYGLTRLLNGVLVRVSPGDPVTFISISFLLSGLQAVPATFRRDAQQILIRHVFCVTTSSKMFSDTLDDHLWTAYPR